MDRSLPLLACLALAGCNVTPPEETPTATEPAAATAESGSGTAEAAQAEANEEATSQPTSQPTSRPTAANDALPAVAERNAMAKPFPEWVEARTMETVERLAGDDPGTDDPGRLLLLAMNAHGTHAAWFHNGPLTFRFTYSPVDGTARDSVQTIDTWRSRAVHHLPDNEEVKFGWDGENAWVSDPDVELSVNPRFWSLTPFYFVGVPFVLGDPGTNVELLDDEVFEERTYRRVKVTYDEGVGDAPDDYYIVYIDSETHRVGGVRYIVSFPGFFAEGEHSPEKFMAYDGAQVVNGITFPESFRTFSLNEDGTINELVTNSTLTDVEFEPGLPMSAFDMPEGATALDGLGSR